MSSIDEQKQWADDHGYVHYTCQIHGGFYSDGAPHCERCGAGETDADKPDDVPVCDWCGDPLGDKTVKWDDGSVVHDYCDEEARIAAEQAGCE